MGKISKLILEGNLDLLQQSRFSSKIKKKLAFVIKANEKGN